MRVEIPTCAKCCGCIPLRHGIIISGYLNLLFSLMVVALETTISIKYMPSLEHLAMYRGVTFYCQIWVTIILYFSEIVFSIILIIGAHMKRMSMLRAFYYYSITTTSALLVIFLLVGFRFHVDWGYYIFDFSMTFCAFVFQIYLLLLIRSELKKAKNKNQLTFVNHVSEIVINGPMPEGRNPL